MGTRSFVNSVHAVHHMPGLGSAPVRIALPGTQALLMHQSLGALLHVIRGVRFEEQTGLSEAVLRKLLEEFNVWVNACEHDAQGVIIIEDAKGNPIGKFEKDFGPVEIRAMRNVIEIVMLDLGKNEFLTITGFTLAQGKQLLDELNSLLLEPLHLEEQTTPLAH